MVNVTIYSSTMDPMGYGNHMCFPWFMLVYRSVPNHPTVFGDIFLGPFCQSLSLSPKSPIFSQKPQVGTCFPVRYIITSPGLKNYQDPSFFVAGEDAAGLATTTLVLPNLRDPDFLTLLMFLGRPRSRHWSGYVFSTNLGTSSHLNIYCGNISYVLWYLLVGSLWS